MLDFGLLVSKYTPQVISFISYLKPTFTHIFIYWNVKYYVGFYTYM